MEQSARSGLPAVSCKKNFPESHIINPLLTKSFDKHRPEQKKKSFLSTANKTPVGKLMKISDVTGNQLLFVERSVQACFVHKLENTQI